MSQSVRGHWILLLPLFFTLSCGSVPPTQAVHDPITQVVVNPGSATLEVGRTLELSAHALDTIGRPQQGRRIFWASSDDQVATVSSSGVVTARRTGQAEIAASAEGKSAISRITVVRRPVATVSVQPSDGEVSPGGTVQLQASTYDSDGQRLDGREVEWRSSAPGVASVNSSGRVTGQSTGSATITATSEGRSGTARVQVTAAPVHQVTISSPSNQLRAGEILQLTARTFDASGRELTGRQIQWSSSNTGIARVDGNGRVTGVAAGTAAITATSEGRSASISLTVLQPAVASVTVEPSTATLAVGATRQLTATARASDGRIVTGRPVSWSSSDTRVATVSSAGLVTAVAAGTATITATIEGRSGSAQITVSAPPPPPPPDDGPVVRVEVSPASVTLSARNAETQQLQARAYSAAGREITGLAVTWTSSDSSVARVSSTGLVTAVGPGSAVITARISGVSGTASVSVNMAR